MIEQVQHRLVPKLWSTFLVWSLMTSIAVAGPAYPLKLSPGNHYLVDQNNNPFFIQGDSPWYLIQKLNRADVDYYLSNRWVQGFNAIILDLQSHQFGSGPGSNPSADIYGNLPFTNTLSGLYTNFLSVNPRYYTNADYVIQRAGAYGMNVFLFPLYAGYQGGPQGWYADMVGNGSNILYQFGRFVGNRYKNFTNIVWVLGGDYTMPDRSLDEALAAGILSVDTNHLFTAHAGRNVSGFDYYSSPWNVLNSTYTGNIAYQKALSDYQRTPVAPTFLIESYYEGATSALGCRQEAWGAVLSGCAGHLYGKSSLWQFSSGWQGDLWSPGATTITNIIKLMNIIDWYNCVPDANHSVITGGYGTWGDVNYISAMREPSGRLVVAYLPQGTLTPTIDMTKLAGATASASWFDPRSGALTAIGTYGTTGLRTFSPPDANDWVLLLEGQTATNTPPTISALPSKYLRTNQSSGPIAFSVGDSETPAADLIVWADSSNPMLIPTNRILFSGSGSSRTVTLTPNSDQEGTALITLKVSDGLATTSTGFQLTVNAAIIPPALLRVVTNGVGGISPNPNDVAFTIGKSYSLTAIPGEGNVFAGWTGSYTSADAKLKFLLVSNVMLEASFIANPFLSIAGTYNGLYREADQVRLPSSGSFTLSVTSRGSYSGHVLAHSGRYRFSGKLNFERQATNVIARNGASRLMLNLRLGTSAAEADKVFGDVTDANWLATLQGNLAVFNAKTYPAPYTNRFTMVFPGSDGGDLLPAGDGVGTILVDRNGGVSFKGILADGTRLIQEVPISRDGLWPLYCRLYSGGGAVWSWVRLQNRTDDDVTGAFAWIKTAKDSARYYPAGFTNQAGEIVGSVYQMSDLAAVLGFSNALVHFAGGNVITDYTDAVAIGASGRVSDLGGNRLSLKFAVANGSFSGRTIDPSTGQSSLFRGVVLQSDNTGRGFVLGTNQSGRVALVALPDGA